MKVCRSVLILFALYMLGACSLNPLRSSKIPDSSSEPSIAVEPAMGSGVPSSGTTASSATSMPPKPATARSDSPGGTSRRGAYYMDDGPGSEPAPDHRTVPDAQPRREPLLSRANRPYAVFGRNYQPMTALVPYQQRGFASWYGRKFHGQKTASGEVYNMYAMTAAHPTLPIPSYVRVTNTRTGERVIVRVNDRGPFLNDRLIDLSYTAAAKLGYIQAGSAQVDVELLSFQDGDPINATALIAQSPATAGSTNVKKSEALLAALANPPSAGLVASPPVPSPAMPSSSVPSPPVPSPPAELREERLQVEITVKQDDVVSVPNAKPSAAISAEKPTAAPTTILAGTSVVAPTIESVAAPAKTYLQLGAFSTSESAESTREKVRKQLDWFKHPIEIISETGLFKLRAGPYGNRSDANAMAERIRVATGSKPFLMMR